MKQQETKNGNSLTARGFESVAGAQLPAEVEEVYEWYEKTFQFVPNLARVMGGAPALLRSYWQTQLNLQQYGKLSSAENNVVQMTVARENTCRYCVAGHVLAGRVFFGTPEDVMREIGEGSALSDEKLNALRSFTLRVYETRGRVSDDDINAFLEAGYTRGQALDVVANIAAKVMSNLTNQLAGTELDDAIKPLAAPLNF